MNTDQTPIPPLSPLAKRYLWVFIISTILGLIMVFFSVASRREQINALSKAGLARDIMGRIVPAPHASEPPRDDTPPAR